MKRFELEEFFGCLAILLILSLFILMLAALGMVVVRGLGSEVSYFASVVIVGITVAIGNVIRALNKE